MAWAIGFDLGGTNMRCALVSDRGDLASHRTKPTLAHRGHDAVIADIVALIREVLREGDRPVTGVGMASPGPLNPKTGVVLRTPNLRWYNVPLKDKLEQALGLPVTVDNDSQMMAYGEWWKGSAQGYSHVLCLTLGTGVGGGVLINGRIYHGYSGSAGHIGHMIVEPDGARCGCGASGCLEAYASATAIARRARERLGGRPNSAVAKYCNDLDKLTSYNVFQAASEGDALALEVFEETGYYLALALASAIPLFDPQVVVISGQAAEAGDFIFKPLRERLDDLLKLRPAVPVVPGALGDDAGIIGAAGVVFLGGRPSID
jgi:glucokinase